MVKIQIDVTKKGVKFDPPIPVIKRLDDIEVEMNFFKNSEIDSVELSEFMVLTNSSGQYVEHKSATQDWHKNRGQSRKFTRSSKNSEKIKKKLAARGNVGGTVGRYVKFKVTMTHENGTEMNVDPILDERPGG